MEHLRKWPVFRVFQFGFGVGGGAIFGRARRTSAFMVYLVEREACDIRCNPPTLKWDVSGCVVVACL